MKKNLFLIFLLLSATVQSIAQDILLDRSNWTVTTSIKGAKDNVVKGINPEYIIDNDTTTSFLFVKPGREYEGITAPSNYSPSFIIDTKEEHVVDLFVYKHRANGNTSNRIRAYAISIYGNNANDDNFQPIKEDIVLNTSLDAERITLSQTVSYRYIKVVITDWYKSDGYTIQVAEFYIGKADDSVKDDDPIIVGNDDIFTPEGVKAEAERVAAWQQNNFSYNFSGNESGITVWTNATLYIGLSRWAEVSDNAAAHYEWLYTKGETMDWSMGEHLKNSYSYYHADEFCVGQTFLTLYDKYKEDKMLASTINRLDWVINNPPNPSMTSSNKRSWTWCDALFMAPPVYAQVAAVTQNDKYLQFMDAEFKKTYNHLFDSDEDLFFRDAAYFNQREANGEKVFWGRGNGWSFAGIVNVLRELPADSPYRSFYETLYRKMALRLLEIQNANGAWHASLLDPVSYPSPETSATGLITYAMVYGLNNGLLTEEEALLPVLKAWSRLCAAIQSNGKLGWVQPVGQDPKTITADMTATFGVGAFLLAASEIYKLVENPIDLVPEISLSAKTMSLNEGRCKKLNVYLFPCATGETVNWHSSNPAVASVSATGEICGLTEGQTTITATLSANPSVTAVCEVEVKSVQYLKDVFFDFGTATSQVSAGAVKVCKTTLFETNDSYGWLSDNISTLGDRYLAQPAGNVELRGFNVGKDPITFRALLENGAYSVTVTQGDADYPHEYMIVKANNIVKLENITALKGEYKINTFDVTVTNNTLDLEFSKVKQGDPNWAVNSVKIKQTSSAGTNEMFAPDYFKHPDTNITVYDLQGRTILNTTLGYHDYKTLLKNNIPANGLYIVLLQLEGHTKTVKIAIDK